MWRLALKRQYSYSRELYKSLQSEATAFKSQEPFLLFCQRMSKLGEVHAEHIQQTQKRDYELKMAVLASKEPVREALDIYIRHRSTFTSEHISTSLDYISKMMKSRPAILYDDYTVEEMKNTWQFQQLIDDLTQAVAGELPMEKWHLARTMLSLSEIGYIDQELFKSIVQRLNQESTGVGIMANAEFTEHVRTLLSWKYLPINHAINPDFQSTLNEAFVNKSVQKNLAEGIFNVRTEYYRLLEMQKDPSIENNPEISEDLVELQEMLVKAGLIHPEEFEDSANFTDINIQMRNAEKTFNSIVNDYYPGIKSSVVDAVYEASKPYFYPTTDPNYKLPPINALDSNILGNCILGLSRAARTHQVAANSIWNDQFKESEADRIETRYTLAYVEYRGIIENLIRKHRALIGSGSSQGISKILKGMAEARVFCQDTLDLSINVLSKCDTIPQKDLSRIAFALGSFASNPEFTDKILSQMDVPTQLFEDSLHNLWTACVHKLSHHYATFVSHLNSFTVKDLSQSNREVLKSVALTFELEAPQHEFIGNLSEQIAISRHRMLYETQSFDPVKPLVRRSFRALMNQGLTPEETEVYRNQLEAAEAYPEYLYDDIIAIDGQKVAVFFRGKEEIATGEHKLMCRHLRALKYTPMSVAIEDILDIDYSKGRIALKENITNLPEIPSQNYLADLEEFTGKLLDYCKNCPKEEKLVLSGLLSHFLKLFKLQSIAKVSVQGHQSALNDLKLQLLKTHEYFKSLDSSAQLVINKMLKGQSLLDLLKSVNSSIRVKPTDSLPSWSGKRQRNELIKQSPASSITQEMLNQGFLWVSDYFHYESWHDLLVKEYPLALDMNMEADGLHNEFYFGQRRQAYGITPSSQKKKNLLGKNIEAQARFIAALSNIKYELKRNYSDEELLEKILGLKMIETIMNKKVYMKSTYLPREGYVPFVLKQTQEKYHTIAYKRYFKQVQKEESAKTNLFLNLESMLKRVTESNMPIGNRQIVKNRLITKYLALLEHQNRDDPDKNIKLLDMNEQTLQMKTDELSLKEEEIQIEDPDYYMHESEEDYIFFKMRKAHATLPKLRVFYKLFKDQALSANEQQFLQNYLKTVQSSSLIDAGNIAMPSTLTTLKIGDMDPEDRSFLTSLRNVSFEDLESFSLSDLVFELSQFVDETFVQTIETKLVKDSVFKAWGVATTTPVPNKSLWLHNLSIEEFLWREAGKLNETEIKDYLDMFGIVRGKSYADKIYWDLDKKSFLDFLKDTNRFDNRLKFVKEWYRRKFSEAKDRTAIPTGKFRATDNEMRDLISAEREKKYEGILKSQLDLEWNSITSQSLKVLVEYLKENVMIYQVNDDLIELVKAVLTHPSLSERDREEITTIGFKYRIPLNGNGYLCETPVLVRGDKIPDTQIHPYDRGNPSAVLINKLLNFN